MANDTDFIEARPAYGFIHQDSNFSEQKVLGREELARSYYLMAKVQYDKSDFDKAERNFLKSLEMADSPKDIYTIFKAHGFLIRIASERLEDLKAQKYIEESDKLIEQISTTLGSLTAEYFYNVGVVKTYRGEFKEARENYLLAYNKSKEENDPELLSKCILALGISFYNSKNYDVALDYLHQLNQLLKIIKKSYLCGSMFFFTAKIYSDLGHYDQALNYLRKSMAHLQEKKCWNMIGYIYLARGTVYKRMGDYDRAQLFYELALESIDQSLFKRLAGLIKSEIEDVNDSNVDLYLDKSNRKVVEKILGTIDFKHRFVLLEILFLLAKNSGQYYDKDKLAKEIWKDEYNPLIHDKLIYTSISRLRKLIEPKNGSGEKRKYIIRGKDGYTFNPLARIRFHVEDTVTINQSIANIEISSPV
ncbi:MAG: tetratricopeptide repeat protein [Halobacteriovoraceae bacterium]|nr:tetratricopeptide repeat protein [Halobacteriovoraceae bacterium]